MDLFANYAWGKLQAIISKKIMWTVYAFGYTRIFHAEDDLFE